MNVLNNYTAQTPAIQNTKRFEKTSDKPNEKKDILDKFSEKVVNKKDINDTVTVPRAIFKGYLCFTAGTALNAIAGMLKKENKVTKGLAIGGSLMSIYGTFNFVKPFLIKEKDLTKDEN